MAVFLGGCSFAKKQQLVSQTYVSMGTVVGVNLYVEDMELGEETQTLIAQELTRLEDEMLSYRVEGSEIWEINHSGGEPVQLSDMLYRYLSDIWELSEKSGGALDVTVGEVTRLWNIDTYAGSPEGFALPEEETLAAALENVGYEKIVMKQSLTMPRGMTIDLGAVGKGIACDVIQDILEEQRIPAAVISVGGSNLIWGKKENGLGWMIGVTHPREEGTYLGYLRLEGGCFVATSGDYERYVKVDGERYHHIMDPDTGYPAKSGVCSVTIVSDSGLLCDALSTACFVLGKNEGVKLAEQCGAEALFVEEDGTVTMTEGMKKLWLTEVK
ncbi:MAG: FAD:protein FMN transferase [Lachnospiraceae bacterium]|nr:FAD:protein FMN transferase [Lachnospiraceae bacterium]